MKRRITCRIFRVSVYCRCSPAGMWYGRESLNIIGSLFLHRILCGQCSKSTQKDHNPMHCWIFMFNMWRETERSVREGKSIWWVGNLKWGWPWRSSGWVVGLCRTDHSLLARERWQVYNYYRTCCPAVQPPCPPPNSADVLQHCGTHFLHSSRQHLCNNALLQLC